MKTVTISAIVLFGAALVIAVLGVLYYEFPPISDGDYKQSVSEELSAEQKNRIINLTGWKWFQEGELKQFRVVPRANIEESLYFFTTAPEPPEKAVNMDFAEGMVEIISSHFEISKRSIHADLKKPVWSKTIFNNDKQWSFDFLYGEKNGGYLYVKLITGTPD